MGLYHIALKIEFDGLCCLLFLGVNNLSVYLRGSDVGMRTGMTGTQVFFQTAMRYGTQAI